MYAFKLTRVRIARNELRVRWLVGDQLQNSADRFYDGYAGECLRGLSPKTRDVAAELLAFKFDRSRDFR